MIKTDNSQVYARLKKLYFTLGIDVKDKDENDAEIYCYSMVIDKIKNEIGVALDKLFCVSVDSMDMYIEMLNINSENKSYDILLNEIIERLSMNFGEFKKSLYDKSLIQANNVEYRIVNNSIIFNSIKREDLPKLHIFIEAWRAFFNSYNYDNKNNGGQSFDEWDSWQESWAYYDGLKLCWNFLETYKENV